MVKCNRLLKLGYLIILFLGIDVLAQCTTSKETPAASSLEAGFFDPATEYRPLALWPWLNGYVDTTRMVYELEQMKDKGMRGAVIWDIGALIDPDKIIPTGPAFLGDKSLEYISLALKTSGRLGLDLGMVASSSWNAGGEWIEPADASMELLSSRQVVQGPARQKIKITKPESELGEVTRYKLVTSLAVPYTPEKLIDYTQNQIILLDDFTVGEELIDWELPEGQWEIISFFMSNTGQNLVVPSPNSNGLVIDHLSQKATENHFDAILSKLAPISTLDDHLKFLMLDSYEVWEMKDWSPALLKEFEARYNYDPRSYLPLLQGYSSTDTLVDARFRNDYSILVSDMMIENHFAQSVEIAEKNDIQMLTEAGHGGYPRVDPLKALGNSHIPMGEFWNRRQFWVTKEAASAAHIYGKEVVAAESLTGWNHWQQGPSDFKQLIDMAFCQGLNQVVFHTFTHNPESAGKPGFVYHAGEHINVNTTWWEMAKPFMDYIARSSYMLRQGNFVGDACLYYGDQAPNLVPPKRIDPNILPLYSDEQCLHCGKPKPVNPGEMAGYDFDYMNADIITNVLKVEDGRLILPSGQSYRVMMLPDRVDISLEVLKSLQRLVRDGAVILGRRPERTTSLKDFPQSDEVVHEIARELWGDIDGKSVYSNQYGKGKVFWGKSLKQVLTELQVSPDFVVTGTDNQDHHIDYIHRQTASEDIYFVSNSSRKEEKVTVTFRVKSTTIPELWDAETGLIQRNISHKNLGSGIQLDLTLSPISSRFVVFREGATSNNFAEPSEDLQFGFSRNKPIGSIDVTNNWTMQFDPALGGPESYQLDELTSWTNVPVEGIKYYSGNATYTRQVEIEEGLISKETEVFIKFQGIQETAHIFVNGEDCGILWTPPYQANITRHIKAGKNNIEVVVTNTWNNRIVGDLVDPGQTFTKTNARGKFKVDSPLLESGLTGMAEVVFVNK